MEVVERNGWADIVKDWRPVQRVIVVGQRGAENHFSGASSGIES
jgi:hypothetical protein